MVTVEMIGKECENSPRDTGPDYSIDALIEED